MGNKFLAEKYGRALFQVAIKTKDEKNVFEDLQSLDYLLNAERSIKRVLTSSVLRKDKASRILKLISGKLKLHKITTSFIKILHLNARFKLLHEIQQVFKELLYFRNRVTELKITSAIKLSQSEMDDIKKTLNSILKAEVECIYDIDENLIGGVTIQHKSLLIDDSIRSKLIGMKNLSVSKLESFELNQQEL